MSNKFWLIQRGTFNKDLKGPTDLFGPREVHLIHGDYMGSSEFEFGAIPAAYARLMDQFSEYGFHADVMRTIRGVPVNLFCKNEQLDATVEAIKAYIEEPYHLQEWICLQNHFKLGSDFDKYGLKTNFWRCIDHGHSPDTSKHILGDWMLFSGAKDRQDAFMRTINHDYNDWWLQLDENTRKLKVKEGWRR